MMSRLQMLQAVQHDKRRTLSAPAAITDTSTTQASELQMTVLSPDVVKYAENLRFFQNVCIQDTQTLLPKKDGVARIPITNAHLTLTESHTEGDQRSYTEMTNIDTVSITPAAKLGAIGIAKELIDTHSLDFIDLAKYSVVQHHEEALDDAVSTAIDTGATTNITYGGSASDASGLATGDTMTLDLVVDAMAQIRAYAFKPKYIFVASAQEKVFLKSSQFTNAAEYGSDAVRINGEIGTEKWLGLKIIVTENTKTYAGSATDLTDATAWGAAGHSCAVVGEHIGRPVGPAIAWKEKLKVDYEYLKKYATHYIYYDANYACGVVQPKAISLIKVTDA